MKTQQKRGKRSSYTIWVVSGVAVLLAAGLIGASAWSARNGEPAAPGDQVAGDPKPGAPDGQTGGDAEPGAPDGRAISDAERGAERNALGPADAPVTVIEYMDYV